ncbi:hypothetical protein FJY84_04630 [Candidatus Bathyarchaeota archaeon]|nr:hypothetical protein [Candidatus Bathyarchaeota archaeon]
MATAEDILLTRFKIEGVSEYCNSIGNVKSALLNHTMSVEQANTALSGLGKESQVLNRANNMMAAEFRANNAGLLAAGRALNDIGSIGRSVTQMWQSYSVAQIRVGDASRALDNAQSDVLVLQNSLNRAMASGDIEQITNLTMRLNHAQNQVKKSSEELNKAQQDNILGYVGMGLQMANVLGKLPTLAMHMNLMKTFTIEQTAATITNTAATYASAAADIAHTVAIKAKSAALAIWHSLNPAGWAILGGAAMIGVGALALTQQGSQISNSSTNLNYSPTFYGGGAEANAKEDFGQLVDSLRRRGIG